MDLFYFESKLVWLLTKFHFCTCIFTFVVTSFGIISPPSPSQYCLLTLSGYSWIHWHLYSTDFADIYVDVGNLSTDMSSVNGLGTSQCLASGHPGWYWCHFSARLYTLIILLLCMFCRFLYCCRCPWYFFDWSRCCLSQKLQYFMDSIFPLFLTLKWTESKRVIHIGYHGILYHCHFNFFSILRSFSILVVVETVCLLQPVRQSTCSEYNLL